MTSVYGEETGDRTVELWVRSFAPAAAGPKRDRTIDRLERLANAGAIGAFDVGVWGTTVERTDSVPRLPQGRQIDDRLAAFDRWADRAGRSLDPFFRTRRIESTITGECYRVCRLPTVAVAEYEGDRLVHVAPSTTAGGEETIEVDDRLAVLERNAPIDAVDSRESENDRSDRIRGEQSPAGR